ncbi:MAG TPA: hypothetical protein VF178_01495 [Gemmatimonadaceae bacterium]
MRRSPILLAFIDNAFHEVYVTDDDRSFFDAVIVGQRVYRRDLVRGDSVAVFEDSALAAIAADYAAAHPNERPLEANEDAAPDPATFAVTDTEIIDVLGPFADLQQHIDITLESGATRHTTRRAVIDLRTGKRMTLAALVPEAVRDEVVRAGREAFDAAQDSVRASDDERAQIASQHLDVFTFDSSSFSLVLSDDGKPAVSFFAPGEGPEGGDLGLPLEPIEIPPGSWWEEIAPVLPTERTEQADIWTAPGYQVVAAYDSVSTTALVLLRDTNGEEWPVGAFPTPVWRVHRLDGSRTSNATRRALARAFEEASVYPEAIGRSALRRVATPGSGMIAAASRR